MSKKYSQEQVAKLVGVTEKVISSYETGARKPKYETLVQLAEVFETTTDSLLGKKQRTCVYLDDLSEEDRELVFELVELLRRRKV